jgi:hypothetical protein
MSSEVAELVSPFAPDLADAREIHDRCVVGDFLRAALLAAGRVFGGLPEVDPSFEALMVAYHVDHEVHALAWPEWCYSTAAIEEVVQTRPNSARLVFLAAQCQRAGEQVSSADTFPKHSGDNLLEAFNDVPEVRNWLAAFLEATSIPGLWEQVCRPSQDPGAEYRESLRAFTARYENGLLHRKDKAAYIRRQDYYVSSQQSIRLLHERLKPDGLALLTPEEKKAIESWLEKKPEWITKSWHESTERVSGKVKLHGNQRTELVRRAAEYHDLAIRVWRAAQDLGSVIVQVKDVERLQKQLRDLRPIALDRAQGQPWGPLFRHLTGRLPS